MRKILTLVAGLLLLFTLLDESKSDVATFVEAQSLFFQETEKEQCFCEVSSFWKKVRRKWGKSFISIIWGSFYVIYLVVTVTIDDEFSFGTKKKKSNWKYFLGKKTGQLIFENC